MAFRFYKRKKILPGVSLNFSKSGVSTSIGPKGAKITIGPRGIRTTVGIPGTGLYHTETYSKKKVSPKVVRKPASNFSGLGCSLLLGVFFLLLSGAGWGFTLIGIVFLLCTGLILISGISNTSASKIDDKSNDSSDLTKNEIEHQKHKNIIENQITPSNIREQNSEEQDLHQRPEELKKCPQCAESIMRNAKICRFCGHHFRIIYTLTVYGPEDAKKCYFLSKKIADKGRKSFSEINTSLKNGMLLKYSAINIRDKNKRSFENYGCKVREGEIISNV